MMLTEPERKLIDEAVYSIFPELTAYHAEPLDNAVCDVIALRMADFFNNFVGNLEGESLEYVMEFLRSSARQYAGKVGE